MLKNCVFRLSVDTKQWAKAAAVRAVKTMAQTFVATIGTAAVMGDVNWAMVASASVSTAAREEENISRVPCAGFMFSGSTAPAAAAMPIAKATTLIANIAHAAIFTTGEK